MTDRTDEVREFRRLVGRLIFGATFLKRDGSLRSGSFRLGVQKDLTGAGSAYDRESRGNVTVFDMNKQAYRTIRLDALQSLTVRGHTVDVNTEVLTSQGGSARIGGDTDPAPQEAP